MTAILAFGVSNLVNLCLKINSPTLSLQLCVGLLMKDKETGKIALVTGHGLDHAKRYSTCCKKVLGQWKLLLEIIFNRMQQNHDLEDINLLSFSLVTAIIESVVLKL